MLSTLKKHLTYANVVASLALFCVLGGGMAVAAGLKKDSVKAKQIAANAVKTVEIADGAVTTPKLADDAATGAKVDEASLGQVPSAATADTATTADTAGTANMAGAAQTAETAKSADSATNAANANLAQLSQNSNQLAGRTLAQVRSTFVTDDATANDDLSIAEETVDGLTANVSGGTGDANVVATVTLQNNGVAQAAPSCRLRSAGTPISEFAFVTLEPGNFGTLTLVGLDEDVNAAQIAVSCAGGSAQNDDVNFDAGNLVVEKTPVG